MNASIKNLAYFKYSFGISMLIAFGLYSNIVDFFYLTEMYSCSVGFNICEYKSFSGILASHYVFYTLHLLKIFLFFCLFFSSRIKPFLISIFLINIYFVFLNPYLYSPDIPYVQFLILTLILGNDKKDSFFEDVFFPFMTVVYLSYAFSGFYKINTPDWTSGNFLYIFLSSNHLTHSFVDRIPLNISLLHYITFFALYSEALAFLAIFNRYLRVFFWFNLTVLHIVLLIIADLGQVSFGMMVVHLFLIDITTWSILEKVYIKFFARFSGKFSYFRKF